ncbi:hypothetical protein UlMin_015828 [Ulmus minor]
MMKSKGHQNIEIKRIEDNNKRHVSFSKHKLGLFNKATELNVLTGTKLDVLVFSKRDKVFFFRSPSWGKKALDEAAYLGFWWDRSFENMGLDELMKFEAALLRLKENVEEKSKEMNKKLSSNFSSLPFDSHV